MPYVWLWLPIAQLLLILPNRWKVYLHCREGSTLLAHANACVMCIFRFSRIFFRPVQVFYIFYSRGLLLLSYDDSSYVPNHGTAATLAYINRELTNTLVFFISPRGSCGREEKHSMRYYSGGSVSDFSQFLPRWTGRGSRDKMQVYLRTDLTSLSRLRIPDEPPPPRIARHCDPLRLRIFALRNVRSLQP